MNTTSDGGNQHERGVRGDPEGDRGHGDGTRDQMCMRIKELEAARDHLRARLREQIEKWWAEHERMQNLRRFNKGWESQLFPETIYRMCADTLAGILAADLLAVLTEPTQDGKEHNDNDLARVVTMGEGTDSRTASEDVAGSVGLTTPDQKRHQPKGR